MKTRAIEQQRMDIIDSGAHKAVYGQVERTLRDRLEDIVVWPLFSRMHGPRIKGGGGAELRKRLITDMQATREDNG